MAVHSRLIGRRVPSSLAPLGCLPPASLLKPCLDLAALQDRIKTYTSTQIPVSSHLHRRLDDFFPCLRCLGFSLPSSIFLYISYKKKASYWVNKMSHLFHMVFLMDNHPHLADKESYHYNICPSSTSIHPSLYPQDGHCLVWAKQSATYRRLRTQCCFSCTTDSSGIYPLFMRKPDSFNRYFWSTSKVLAHLKYNTAKAKKKKKRKTKPQRQIHSFMELTF